MHEEQIETEEWKRGKENPLLKRRRAKTYDPSKKYILL